MIHKKIKFKNLFVWFLFLLLIIPTYAKAYSEYIIPGGENIGIELSSKGIMIVGLYKVNEIYPGRDAGLRVGDIINKVNGKNVTTINELAAQINDSPRSDSVSVGFIREQTNQLTQLTLYKDDTGVYKTGLYVKDKITGVGTLTFIDPNSKSFGALGHEIIEKSTGKILEIKDGMIFESTVTGIQKSQNGSPGEKNARFFTDQINGNVSKNTDKGIFGTYTDVLPNKELKKVAKPSEVKLGNAKILTVLKDTGIKEYDIKITSFNQNQSTKNIVFEIVDQELLNITGGVVQGMSGSPIIQDEFIVGAVTHVVVDNPTKGYGIYITNMLKEVTQ